MDIQARKFTTFFFAMIGLQLVWTAAIWLSGATASAKVPLLGVYSVVLGAVVFILPQAVWHDLRSLFRVKGNELTWLTILCLILFAAGIVYATYQRIWPYDEEGAHAASFILATQGLGTFLEQYTTLSWLGPQHPPLAILLYGAVMAVFGTQLFVARMVALMFAIGSVIATFYVGSELYNRQLALLAALFMATFPLFIRLGTAAMTDVPVTFFAVTTIWLVILMERRESLALALVAGCVAGLGLLTKYTFALVFPVVFAYFLLHQSVRRSISRLALFGSVAALFLLAWFGVAYYSGIIGAQHEQLAIYTGVVTSSSTNWGRLLLLESLVTRLPSAIGVYSIPLIPLALVVMWRSKSNSDVFLVLWVFLISLPLLVMLPDHRYFMLAFPALATMMAIAVNHMPEFGFRVVLLVTLYSAGALYLFVDWFRASTLFLPQ